MNAPLPNLSACPAHEFPVFAPVVILPAEAVPPAETAPPAAAVPRATAQPIELLAAQSPADNAASESTRFSSPAYVAALLRDFQPTGDLRAELSQPPEEFARRQQTGDSSSAVTFSETRASGEAIDLLGDTPAPDDSNSPPSSALDEGCDGADATDGEPCAEDDAPGDSFHMYWVPPGIDLSEWPAELRADVAQLINPLYHELVLMAKPGLARSIGNTIVYLTWLEILDQLQIGLLTPAHDALVEQLVGPGASRSAQIDRLLRVIGAKLRVSQFLLRLQDLKSSPGQLPHAESQRTPR